MGARFRQCWCGCESEAHEHGENLEGNPDIAFEPVHEVIAHHVILADIGHSVSRDAAALMLRVRCELLNSIWN